MTTTMRAMITEHYCGAPGGADSAGGHPGGLDDLDLDALHDRLHLTLVVAGALTVPVTRTLSPRLRPNSAPPVLGGGAVLSVRYAASGAWRLCLRRLPCVVSAPTYPHSRQGA
jgi:hypothetical protein